MQAGQADQTGRAWQEGRRGRELQGSLGRAVQGLADRSGRQGTGRSGCTSRQAGQVRKTKQSRAGRHAWQDGPDRAGQAG